MSPKKVGGCFLVLRKHQQKGGPLKQAPSNHQNKQNSPHNCGTIKHFSGNFEQPWDNNTFFFFFRGNVEVPGPPPQPKCPPRRPGGGVARSSPRARPESAASLPSAGGAAAASFWATETPQARRVRGRGAGRRRGGGGKAPTPASWWFPANPLRFYGFLVGLVGVSISPD